MANDCERRFHQHMQLCYANRAKDHNQQVLEDFVYCHKQECEEQECIKLYRAQIAVLEAVRGNIVTFLNGVVKIGVLHTVHRHFFTRAQRSQPSKLTLTQIAAL